MYERLPRTVYRCDDRDGYYVSVLFVLVEVSTGSVFVGDHDDEGEDGEEKR